MSKRQSIKKADAETTEGGTHQLTDIQVHEVSVVDRAANKRRFLTTKADETPAETAARIQAKIAARGDLTPGAEADATTVAKDDLSSSDVNDGVPAVSAHAHAASAHAAAATAHAAAAEAANDDDKKKGKKTSKAGVAPLPPPSGVAPASIVVETIADPEAELLALAKSAASEPVAVAASAEVVATKAAEISVTPNDDGSIVITVDDQATTISNPSLPSAVQDKVKTSVVAGIDAIMLRMATLRQNVLNSKGSYSASGTPSELSDLYYICDMLYSLYSIGGPNWEIEQAADAALDASGVAKSADSIKVQKNKVINMARTLKLKAAHEAMEYAHKDMGKVLKELDTEGGDATGEMARGEASTAASTPSGVAPSNFAKAAKDIKEDPAYLSIVEELKKRDEELKKNAVAIASLQKLAANQGELIAKARGSVVTSNAAEQIPVASVQEDVQWDLDLAAPSRPVSKSFGRDNERPRR